MCALTVLIVVGFTMPASVSAGVPRPNLKIHLHIIEIRALDSVDLLDAADFWMTITVSNVAGYGSTWSSTYTSSKPMAWNQNDYIPSTGLWVPFDCPNDWTRASVKIAVYDYDSTTASDHCDVSRISGRSDATMTYYVAGDNWDGHDSATDSNGYGHVSGEEDGYTGDEDDCEVYFYIGDTSWNVSGYGGQVRDNAGNAIAGATVDVFAWRWDNHKTTISGGMDRGGWIKYTTTTTDSYGSFTWGNFAWLKLMYRVYKTGYWEQRLNDSATNQFKLAPDQYVKESTVLAMWGKMNDYSKTQITYEWSTSTTYSASVYAYVAGSGGDLTWTGETLQGGSYVSPDPSTGQTAETYLRCKAVTMHATYWNTAGKVFNIWAIRNANDYLVIKDIPNDHWSAPGSYIKQVTLPPGAVEYYGYSMTGTFTWQLGIDFDLGVSVSAVVLGASMSINVKCGITLSAGVNFYEKITVKNIDPLNPHTYRWASLNGVLHCWQIN